jgi:hypothetical protein
MDGAARKRLTNCVITIENSEDRHRQIIRLTVAKRAYQIFEKRGRRHGFDRRALDVCRKGILAR